MHLKHTLFFMHPEAYAHSAIYNGQPPVSTEECLQCLQSSVVSANGLCGMCGSLASEDLGTCVCRSFDPPLPHGFMIINIKQAWEGLGGVGPVYPMM